MPTAADARCGPRTSTELDLPPSVISTLKAGKPPRLAFGSCRTSVRHDRKGNRTHGVDSMRAYALAMAGITDTGEQLPWPDMVVFLGDQVYADETTDEMQEFIASRRDIDEPPGKELKDFEEYAHLYSLAWSDPANRWLLSTLPSTMIFDDHDIRDDWNTSASWREEMEQTDWWHGRIVAGLASYWVYQHLGNLSAEERADDEIWQRRRQPRRARRARPHRCARRVRRPRRPGAGDLPVELRPRHQRQPARRRRLPRGAGARARRPPDARRRARWPGSTTS